MQPLLIIIYKFFFAYMKISSLLCRMKKDKTKIIQNTGVNVTSDVLVMLDKMCEAETIDGLPRASMVRIAIKEAYAKRFKK